MDNPTDRQQPSFREEAKNRSLEYMTAAFGLVAALAWNDAIKSLIEYFLPASGKTLWAKFSYAVIITILITALTIYLIRRFQSPKN